jgi:glycosyltransferase involved in cell wall biosynthesis
MHIIALEDQPFSTRGGKEMSMLDVCQRLALKNNKITLLYSKYGDLIEQYNQFCQATIPVKSWDVDKQKKLVSIYNFLDSLVRVSYQINISNREPTIAYVDDYKFSLFCSALSFVRQIPSVVHLRHILPGGFQSKYRLGLKTASHFIAVSHHTKSLWETTGFMQPHQIDVVHNGIDPNIFKPTDCLRDMKLKWKIHPATIVISYLGRLDPEKNLETLIKACGILKEYNQMNFELLIAGKPVCHTTPEKAESYYQSLQQLTIDVGIGDRVRFLGHVSSPTSLYQASDITVLPSLNEPFGRTAIESMASGVPVIASNAGGIPEIMTGQFQDYLYEPQNEQALFQKLSNIVLWRQYMPALAEQCRQHVLRNFTISQTVDNIEKVFTKIANKK